jgi:hypothetical protein
MIMSAKEASKVVENNAQMRLVKQLDILRADFERALLMIDKKYLFLSTSSNNSEAVGEFRRELHSLGYITTLSAGPSYTVFIEITWE